LHRRPQQHLVVDEAVVQAGLAAVEKGLADLVEAEMVEVGLVVVSLEGVEVKEVERRSPLYLRRQRQTRSR